MAIIRKWKGVYCGETSGCVRDSDDRDLEFLKKWEGYTQDQNTWKKSETINGSLSGLRYYCHFGHSVFLILQAHNTASSHRGQGWGTEKEETSQRHF